MTTVTRLSRTQWAWRRLRARWRHVCALAIIVAGLAAVLACRPAQADQLVQIAPHWTAVPPQSSTVTPPLLGYLARPYGQGRFPAVVVLHWCSGFSDHDVDAASQLKSWGYVALAVDSLGDANMCQAFGGAAAQAHDAAAAFRYLAAQRFVDAGRVAMLGFSMGGSAVLETVDAQLLPGLSRSPFRAAVAFYPGCAGSSGLMTAPTLVLIGAADDWSSPDACRKLAAHENDIGITRANGPSEPVDLVVYPGATHAFDAPEPARHYLGHFMRYGAAATQDAQIRVRAFLRRTIGDWPDPQ